MTWTVKKQFTHYLDGKEAIAKPGDKFTDGEAKELGLEVKPTLARKDKPKK